MIENNNQKGWTFCNRSAKFHHQRQNVYFTYMYAIKTSFTTKFEYKIHIFIHQKYILMISYQFNVIVIYFAYIHVCKTKNLHNIS